jgi:hypothetical protein
MAKVELASDKIIRLEAERDELISALKDAIPVLSVMSWGGGIVRNWESLINRIERNK